MLSNDMNKIWLIKEADVLVAISSKIIVLVNYIKKSNSLTHNYKIKYDHC